MKHVIFGLFFMNMVSLSATAASAQTVESSDDETMVENFDDERAAEIANAKRALLGLDLDAVTPRAASCGTRGNTSRNVRMNNAAFNGAAKQRSGSSTNCTALGTIQPSDDVLYYCYTFAGNYSWTYLKSLREPNVSGWVRDDLLRGNGSSNPCGF